VPDLSSPKVPSLLVIGEEGKGGKLCPIHRGFCDGWGI